MCPNLVTLLGMWQTCNEEYFQRTGREITEERKPCGRSFDDFDHLTYCPHDSFAPGPALSTWNGPIL